MGLTIPNSQEYLKKSQFGTTLQQALISNYPPKRKFMLMIRIWAGFMGT